MSLAMQPLRLDVVSIQSQVVYGRVGNSIAGLALHEAGLQVAMVPTVLLSNTPNYPTCHGGALPIEWFKGYLDDLAARGALRDLRCILVGYLGSPEQARAVASWIDLVREKRPEVLVIVDPVIGDYDVGIYVEGGLVEAYHDYLLPRADVLTPNGFELEQLLGRSVATLDDTLSVARTMLCHPKQSMVVTSAATKSDLTSELAVAVVDSQSTNVIKHPRVAIAAKGTGDLFSSELAVGLLLGLPLLDSARRACSRVMATLERTFDARSAELILPAQPTPTNGR